MERRSRKTKRKDIKTNKTGISSKNINKYSIISSTGGFYMAIGENIKNLRIKNNLTQAGLGDKMFVSDKTISSWESGRTYPDIDMLIELCNALDTNMVYLTSGSNKNDTELEIKIRVNQEEQNRVHNIIKEEGKLLRDEEQEATYYKPSNKDFNNEWLRIRKENKNIVLNYKRKENDIVNEYEVNIDNAENLKTIFKYLDFTETVRVNKYRVSYLYKNKYEVSFDDVDDLGFFIEFELKKYDKDYVSEYQDLIKLLYELNININDIETKRYPDLVKLNN